MKYLIRRAVIAAILIGFLSPVTVSARSYRTSPTDVYVHGYYTSKGTYVAPYYRSAPDSSLLNNYSCIDYGRCGGSTVSPSLPIIYPTPVSQPKYSCDAFGPNAYLNGTLCYCKSGFEWNSGMTACVSIVQCGDGYLKRNNQCITYSQDCQSSYGSNTWGVAGPSDNSLCYCLFGYQWNSNQSTCEPVVTTGESTPPSQGEALPTSAALIKTADSPAVYYYWPGNGKRYVFPDDKTFKTWYPDYSQVITVSGQQMASLSVGGNVTYRPGTRLIKISSDPHTYAVSGGGCLRWITNEDVAKGIWGADWMNLVDDTPDSSFVNYKSCQDIVMAGDYRPTAEVINAGSIVTQLGF